MNAFVPSFIEFEYDSIFRAIANPSGRMQYYRIRKGRKRTRISKSEFTNVYHNSNIIAIKPIQDESGLAPIQMDIFVR